MSKHFTAKNFDGYLGKMVTDIENNLERHVRISIVKRHNDRWVIYLEQDGVDERGMGIADTPSEALLKAWHSAVGSELPPF